MRFDADLLFCFIFTRRTFAALARSQFTKKSSFFGYRLVFGTWNDSKKKSKKKKTHTHRLAHYYKTTETELIPWSEFVRRVLTFEIMKSDEIINYEIMRSVHEYLLFWAVLECNANEIWLSLRRCIVQNVELNRRWYKFNAIIMSFGDGLCISLM